MFPFGLLAKPEKVVRQPSLELFQPWSRRLKKIFPFVISYSLWFWRNRNHSKLASCAPKCCTRSILYLNRSIKDFLKKFNILFPFIRQARIWAGKRREGQTFFERRNKNQWGFPLLFLTKNSAFKKKKKRKRTGKQMVAYIFLFFIIIYCNTKATIKKAKLSRQS